MSIVFVTSGSKSAICINGIYVFCTKLHIAKPSPLWYIIIRKGDTNVPLRNGSNKVSELREKSENPKAKSSSDNI